MSTHEAALADRDKDEGWTLYLMNADGTNVRRITQPGSGGG
ncbi:MAG TPA: hypothetical protein VES88_09760 [Gemmatimonadaceae bacterium]|nr:hypothetical protein [Gemmatimonadaceae bacterium]